VVPVGSSDAALLTLTTNKLTTIYGSKISLQSDAIDTTAANFDQLYLSPIKKSQSTLKGGLFFKPSVTSGANTIYEYYSLVSTRSPTSFFFLPTLAA
jgi:ATP-binding cassette, subfamily A (ABC1), member 3